ncbi:MAG: hypothetical protein IJU40_06500, partial [Desulfovibrionaceae bacterium]|nr:hypothetical protein [Desulfovibrionaceae bacterium]
IIHKIIRAILIKNFFIPNLTFDKLIILKKSLNLKKDPLKKIERKDKTLISPIFTYNQPN